MHIWRELYEPKARLLFHVVDPILWDQDFRLLYLKKLTNKACGILWDQEMTQSNKMHLL